MKLQERSVVFIIMLLLAVSVVSPTVTHAATIPSIATSSPSGLWQTTVNLNVSITDDGGASSTNVGFYYGTTTAYGLIASSTGTFGNGSYQVLVAGLTCNTLYHYGDYAMNSAGTATTSDQTFTTAACYAGPNLLANPSGMAGNMSGWNIIQNGGGGWGLGWNSPHSAGSTAFATSYGFDTRDQNINLLSNGYTADELDSGQLSITFGEWIATRGDQGGRYYLNFELLGADDNPANPLATYGVGSEGSPVYLSSGTNWFDQSHTFTNFPSGVRYVYFEDGGRDQSTWGGNYGTDFDDAVIAVDTSNYQQSGGGCGSSYTTLYTATGTITLDSSSGCSERVVTLIPPKTTFYPKLDISVPVVNHGTSSDTSILTATSSISVASSSSMVIVATSTTIVSYDFTKNLKHGDSGAAVIQLQTFLNAQGFLSSSPTGYFGHKTLTALIAFQQAHGISPSLGYLGSITREYVNSLK